MKSFEVEEEGIPFRILWHEGLASLIQVGKKGLWHLVHSFLWQSKSGAQERIFPNQKGLPIEALTKRKQAIRTEERGLERIRYVEREPRRIKVESCRS